MLRWILQENGEFTWRVSDCEELVGLSHRRRWGLFWGIYFEGSEYEFYCLRTDKQSVNVDGLFYITLTVEVIQPHQLNLLSLPHHYLCRFQS